MNEILMRIITALILVESGGDPIAVGRDGELGCLQFTPIMVRDVNRIAGTTYTHEDALNVSHSVNMAEIVLAHYAVTNLPDALMFWRHGPGYKSKAMEQIDVDRSEKVNNRVSGPQPAQEA